MIASSFRARLTIRWTLSFGLLLATANMAIYVASRTLAYRDLDAQVRTLAATELASAFDQPGPVHLHDFPISTLGGRAYATKFGQILSETYQVLAQLPSVTGSVPLLDRRQFARALAGEAPIITVRLADRPGRTTALVTHHEGRTYLIAVGLFTDGLEQNLARLAWLLGAVWLASVAVTAVLGYLLASHALVSIDRITSRAATIAQGDFSARLDPPPTDDEIARMTKLLNEMLDRLEGAVQANRRFASDAAHELRSPLTAMQGEIDVALKRVRPSREYRETLALVRERLAEMSRLTDDLMLLVHAQERSDLVVLTEVPLVPLVRAAGGRVARAAASRKIGIRLDRLPDVVVYADTRLLARVFDNLLLNAVQYNRDGGGVAITGDFEEPQPGDEWATGYVLVRVHDTGVGIPAEERERVFERFYRIDRSRSRRTGGTGLGLSICREVVRLCGGTIRIARSSEEGTTVELRIPGRASPDSVDEVIVPPGERATEAERTVGGR